VKGNLWRPYRGVTVTVFADVKSGGSFKWCLADSTPAFSRRRYATAYEAMLVCWLEHLAPRFGLTP
jgi:hypothetical protein